MKSPMTMILTGSLLALSAAMPLSALAAPKDHASAARIDATTGAIASVNATEVKLANGDTFKLAPGVSTAAFKAGETVRVRWSMKNGAKLAENISAAK